MLIETADARLLLWDTPGFGDTARLLTRLRREGDPIGWFLHQAWDRVLNRPLWCSQEAVRNVRDEADVVLYLVNATEDPEAAGYTPHELEILSWMGRPVLVLLNQVGADHAGPVEERWRRPPRLVPRRARRALARRLQPRLGGGEPAPRTRRAALLEGDKQTAMAASGAPGTRATCVSSRDSLDAIAHYLAEIAVDREPLGPPGESGVAGCASGSRTCARCPGADRERAIGALFDRVQAATRRLMDRLIELHQLSGASHAQVERRLEDAAIQGHQAINPTTGAIVGGAVSGLLTGLGADTLAGGLSLGGGAIVGAMLGRARRVRVRRRLPAGHRRRSRASSSSRRRSIASPARRWCAISSSPITAAAAVTTPISTTRPPG